MCCDASVLSALAALALSLAIGADAPAQAPEPPPSEIGGLSPTSHNVELVGKLRVSGRFGDVRRSQIADVATKGDYAYLSSYQTPDARPGAPEGSCERGGVFIVDISNPAVPR